MLLLAGVTMFDDSALMYYNGIAQTHVHTKEVEHRGGEKDLISNCYKHKLRYERYAEWYLDAL